MSLYKKLFFIYPLDKKKYMGICIIVYENECKYMWAIDTDKISTHYPNLKRKYKF